MAEPTVIPRPQPEATVLLIGGLFITWLAAFGETPLELARSISIGVGISLAVSMFMELRFGQWDNLLHTGFYILILR